MRLNELFDFQLIDESPHADYLNDLQDMIGRKIGLHHVFANCFRFLITNKLVDNYDLITNVSLQKKGDDYQIEEYKVILKFGENLETQFFEQQKSYVEKFLLSDTDQKIKPDITKDNIEVEITNLLQSTSESFESELGFKMNDVPISDVLNWQSQLAEYIAKGPRSKKNVQKTKTAALLNEIVEKNRLEFDLIYENDFSKDPFFLKNLKNNVKTDDCLLGCFSKYLDYIIENHDLLNDPDCRSFLINVFKAIVIKFSDRIKPAIQQWIRDELQERGYYLLKNAENLKLDRFKQTLTDSLRDQLMEKTRELFEHIVLTPKGLAVHKDLKELFRFKFHFPNEYGDRDSYKTKMMQSAYRPYLYIKDDTVHLRWFNSKNERAVLKNEEVMLHLESATESSIFWWTDMTKTTYIKADISTSAGRTNRHYWNSGTKMWEVNHNKYTVKSVFSRINSYKERYEGEIEWFKDFFSEFNFNRNWKIIYGVNNRSKKFTGYDIGNNINLDLYSIRAGGGFSGIGRSDNVQDEEYLWSYAGQFTKNYNNDNNYENSTLGKYLGSFLGMNKDRYVDQSDINSSLAPNKIGKIQYEIFSNSEGNFVKVNLPHYLNKTRLGVNNPISEDSEPLMQTFNFQYFRKVDSDEVNIIKECKKNLPEKPSMPVNFQIDDNFKWLHKKNVFRLSDDSNRSGKQFRLQRAKQNGLVRPDKDPRKPANSVMKKHLRLHHTGSATLYASDFLVENKGARNIWNSIKIEQLNSEDIQIPTNQEWCHLHANSFNGPSEGRNFVSGSKHCNTEQLAIESAQSSVIKKGSNSQDRYELRSTAYLFVKNQGTRNSTRKRKREGNDSDLAAEQIKKRKINGNDSRTIPNSNLNDGSSFLATDNNSTPFSAFIRYKIHKGAEGNTVKVFDYTFEGQSEFFDKNQFRIIQHMARFILLGQDAFNQWFKEKLEKEDQMDTD